MNVAKLVRETVVLKISRERVLLRWGYFVNQLGVAKKYNNDSVPVEITEEPHMAKGGRWEAKFKYSPTSKEMTAFYEQSQDQWRTF